MMQENNHFKREPHSDTGLTINRLTRRKRSGLKKFAGKYIKWLGTNKIQWTAKDRLFRFLFDKDREALLQLYNALNGTDYQDASQLQVVTIESAVYVVMKNDLAFILAGTLNLYEHQSTYAANMPIRFLIYLAEEYQKLIEQAEISLYGSKQIPLPTPQCVVMLFRYRDKKTYSDVSVIPIFHYMTATTA